MKGIGRSLVAYLFVLAACALHSPDLTPQFATELISKAPEFNLYARLVKIESVTRQKDSLSYCCYYGSFLFRYIGAPDGSPPITAYAEFRYWDETWHFTGFDYGCNHSALTGAATASDCHTVHCYNPPAKH